MNWTCSLLRRSSTSRTTCSKACRLSVLCLLVLAAVRTNMIPAKEASALEMPLQAALLKARVNGKYAMLLQQLKVSQDVQKYSEFRDAGLRGWKNYAGYKDLPKGYWVYAYPYWYIWGERSSDVRPKRPWGPEQALGEPDTPGAGDLQTAWASLTPDGQDEWLMLEYAEPIVPDAVFVHETCCPGALTRITAFRLDGTEVEVWHGKDPTLPGSPRGVSECPIKPRFKTSRIKLYLNSKDVLGYNEIDAVGLRDSTGKMHWARAATASSTYADQPQQPAVRGMVIMAAPRNNAQEQRIKQLEAEVKELKESIKELQEKIKKLEKP